MGVVGREADVISRLSMAQLCTKPEDPRRELSIGKGYEALSGEGVSNHCSRNNARNNGRSDRTGNRTGNRTGGTVLVDRAPRQRA